MKVRSSCINCRQKRACIKIEARAPLPPSRATVDNQYEVDGPMVEICRGCVRELIVGGTLGRFLLEGLA